MKKVFLKLLVCVPSLLHSALPPLFPSLVSRLHEAIERGDVEQMRSLIALSADPNELHQNRTALQAAVVYKNPEVIGYLLGCNVPLPDDIIVQLLRSGNQRYPIEHVFKSLKYLLMAGAHKGDVFAIPRGYLTPVVLAHGDSDGIHDRITKLIQYYGKQKIA
jgi:Ankyrin repeats (many copies)